MAKVNCAFICLPQAVMVPLAECAATKLAAW